MKAYVINLARSHDRRSHMASELARTALDYEFVTGVDGTTLDVTNPSLVSPTWLGISPFRPNVAGCALSHLTVYQRILSEGLGVALVLEDDMNLPDDLGPLLDAAQSQVKGAQVVLLNFHSREPCLLSNAGSLALPSSRLMALPVDLHKLGSTGAYLITRTACEHMARAILPVRVPMDQWVFFHDVGALERVYCISPMPIRKSEQFRSAIGNYNPNSLRANVSDMLEKTSFSPVRRALEARRRHIIAQWSRIEFTNSASPYF